MRYGCIYVQQARGSCEMSGNLHLFKKSNFHSHKKKKKPIQTTKFFFCPASFRMESSRQQRSWVFTTNWPEDAAPEWRPQNWSVWDFEMCDYMGLYDFEMFISWSKLKLLRVWGSCCFQPLKSMSCQPYQFHSIPRVGTAGGEVHQHAHKIQTKARSGGQNQPKESKKEPCWLAVSRHQALEVG